MIFKRPLIFRIDRAFAAKWQFGLAIIRHDMDRAQHGLAHRALVRQPVSRIDEGHAIAFGACIIFLDHWPPPVNHRFLDRDWAGCRCMDRARHRGDIIFRTGFRG